MPLPTASQVHVDTLLTNMSIQYTQDTKDFACSQVFPVVPVKKQSDKYAVWSQADFFRIQARQRADGTEAQRAGYRIDTTNTYFCETYALKKSLTLRERANYDSPLDADRAKTNFLTQQMLMLREQIFIAKIFSTSTSNWSTQYTGAGSTSGTARLYWDNASGLPVVDVRLARRTVRQLTGRWPNMMVVSPDVDAALKDNSDVVGRVKYSQLGIITNELLAQMFEVDKYIVASGSYNTVAEGGTASMSNLATAEYAWLGYVTKAPSLDEPSAGYTMSWSEFDSPDLRGGALMKSWFDEAISGDWYEAQMSFDPKITAPGCGAVFSGMLT